MLKLLYINNGNLCILLVKAPKLIIEENQKSQVNKNWEYLG